jgi:hypothetical protein
LTLITFYKKNKSPAPLTVLDGYYFPYILSVSQNLPGNQACDKTVNWFKVSAHACDYSVAAH